MEQITASLAASIRNIAKSVGKGIFARCLLGGIRVDSARRNFVISLGPLVRSRMTRLHLIERDAIFPSDAPCRQPGRRSWRRCVAISG